MQPTKVSLHPRAAEAPPGGSFSDQHIFDMIFKEVMAAKLRRKFDHVKTLFL